MEIEKGLLTEDEIVMKLNSFIDTERGDLFIQFDENITLRVFEYKHEFSDGYTITYQDIAVGDYDIDMCHSGGAKMVERAKKLQKAIAEQGIEKAVLSLTEVKMYEEKTRMWFD